MENQKMQHDQVIEKFDNLNQSNNYHIKFMSDIETALKNIRKNICDSFENMSNSRLETTNSINDIKSEMNIISNTIKNTNEDNCTNTLTIKDELSVLITKSQQYILSKIDDFEKSNHSLIESKSNKIVIKLDHFETESITKIDKISDISYLINEVLNKYVSNFDK